MMVSKVRRGRARLSNCAIYHHSAIGAVLCCRFPLQAFRAKRIRPTGRKREEVGELAVARVDLAIFHEIVRVVQARAKVPERIRVLKREYQITYLDDHRQRIEEALRRPDSDRLSMLFGQLASKVKYQLIRRVVSGSRRASRAGVGQRHTTR